MPICVLIIQGTPTPNLGLPLGTVDLPLNYLRLGLPAVSLVLKKIKSGFTQPPHITLHPLLMLSEAEQQELVALKVQA